MDYEKKYKGALARCKWLLSEGMISRIAATDMFRELMDNDSENIRKEIINIFHSLAEGKIPVDINYADIFTWLEKQGEQSSLNINRECLKGIKRVQEYQDLSDWEKEFDNIASMYAHNKNQEGYNDSWYVKERAAEMLYYAKKELEKQGEQKPIIEMKSAEESLGISSEEYNDIVNECLYGESKAAEWKQENVEELSEFENAMMHIGYSFFGKRGGLDPNDTSSVKVQAQYLLELAQKPTDWSEEDEKVWKELIEEVKDQLDSVPSPDCRDKEDEKALKQLTRWLVWLKSLKDRYTWKPSDEQMNALWDKISNDNLPNSEKEISQQVALTELYEQLKKLKGE